MPVIRKRSSWSTVPSRSFLHWSGPQLSFAAGDIWKLVIVYKVRFQNRMPLRSWAATEEPTSPNKIEANNAQRILASRTWVQASGPYSRRAGRFCRPVEILGGRQVRLVQQTPKMIVAVG